jgi:RNA polymerase sigma factor (sigma-70 family)
VATNAEWYEPAGARRPGTSSAKGADTVRRPDGGAAHAGTPGFLDGLQSRDEATWSSVVKQHEARLRGIGRSFRLNGQEAEDALQRTWLALLNHSSQIRDAECLGAWLSTTMRRECLRERGRRREQLIDDWTSYEAHFSCPDECEALPGVLDRRAMAARVWDLLDDLSPRQRIVLLALYSGDEPSYAEVSARMGMPVGAIGPTRQRALGRLRELVDASGRGGEGRDQELAQLCA